MNDDVRAGGARRSALTVRPDLLGVRGSECVIPQTGIVLIDWFLGALESWGYLIVFGFTIFENLFVVGSFTPGETVVIAGALVASRGSLAISGVWAASVIGTIVGSNISYWLGRRAGLSSVKAFTERIAATRAGRLFRIDADGLDEVHEHFHTDGAKTVLISRFAIGAKNFVPAVAGATEMPVFWYELYTVLGAMLYTSIMCAIGWFLGANLDLALKVASGVGYVGLTIMALFVGGIIVARNRIKARRATRDEQ
jgi:membrane protein DedA with SNARE-associated domain